MGLVSDRDLAHLRSRHLEDSLALQRHLGSAHSLLDIGSGGGFPGLPLAIANPQLKATLVDRNRRKCSFLRHVVMTLKLANVEVINADIRIVGASLDSFDVITARAVANPEQIWTWTRDLLAQKGRLLLQTSSSYEGTLADAAVESHLSAGIGWIGVVRRTVS